MRTPMAQTTSFEASQSAADSDPAAVSVHEEDIGIALWEVFGILARRKKWIAGAALAGGLLAGSIALLMPDTYKATAVIMPPQKEQSAATAMLGQLGPLAAAAGADMGIKSPGDLYVGLLESRTIADHLIEEFGLRAVYHTRTSIETRSKLKSRCQFRTGARDPLIRVEVEDTNPARAAGLANAFTSELNALNKGLSVTDAGKRRAFLEKQLEQEKTALSEAEEAMKKQQAQSGLIQPDAQTAVAIGSVAQLRAQITAGEVAMERLKMGVTSENPELVRSEAEVQALRAQLRRLESGSSSSGTLPAASALPNSNLEYVRRLRDLKYHELLFELLSKQYEAARLDESKAAPDLQVIDLAVPPDQRSGPRRSMITLLGCLAGMFLASTVAYATR